VEAIFLSFEFCVDSLEESTEFFDIAFRYEFYGFVNDTALNEKSTGVQRSAGLTAQTGK
jgi:hypothetical protein